MHPFSLIAWFAFLEFIQVRIDPTITAGQIGEVAIFGVGLITAWIKLKGSVDILKESSDRQYGMHEENTRRLNKLEGLTERIVGLQESEDARLGRLEDRINRIT